MKSSKAVFGFIPEYIPIYDRCTSEYLLMSHDAELHFHNIMEIGICTSGHGISETAGISQPFRAGDTQIVFPFQEHRNVAESDHCVWKWAYIDPFLLSVRFGGNRLLMTELMEQICVYGIIKQDECTALHSQLMAFWNIIDGSSTFYRNERICYMLLLLLIDMAAASADRCTPKVAIPSHLSAILPALMLINDKISTGEQPSVPELADVCRMPLSTFRRLFTSVMEVPPKSHITSCAIQRAARILLSTDKSVAEIAGLSGFSEISTFNRAFRNVTGLSPMEYRAKYLSDFA